MICSKTYLRALNQLPDDPPGGQVLILGEVVGALYGVKRVFLPYPNFTIISALGRVGIEFQPASSRWCSSIVPDDEIDLDRLKDSAGIPDECDGIYFGTPTIVSDKPLFPQDRRWSKIGERRMVQALCHNAKGRRVVCGLGSGDISTEERLADMGGGQVIAYKAFDGFQDWVLMKG